jgi:hypothetical protein
VRAATDEVLNQDLLRNSPGLLDGDEFKTH